MIQTRHRRYFPIVLMAVLWLTGCATPRPALVLSDNDRGAVDQIASYLDGLKSFRADFVQSGAFGDGMGTVWLHRPGQLRIAYTQPAGKTLVAANGRVVAYDGATGGSTTTPLSRTPLEMLLTPSITLSGAVTVTGYRAGPNTSTLTIEKTASPSDGSLTLYLSRAPLALIGVLMTDAYQRPLMIQLSNLQRDPNLTPDLFQYPSAPPGS
jgi:outer membrane lipoprotein-sorting protein